MWVSLLLAVLRKAFPRAPERGFLLPWGNYPFRQPRFRNCAAAFLLHFCHSCCTSCCTSANAISCAEWWQAHPWFCQLKYTALAMLGQKHTPAAELSAKKAWTFYFSPLLFSYFFGGSHNKSTLQFCRNAQDIYSVWQKCTNFSERQKGTKRHETGLLLHNTQTIPWIWKRKAIWLLHRKAVEFQKSSANWSLLFIPFLFFSSLFFSVVR